ncbi:MAG: leucine--tRNA ligase [Bdellovibrionaceae bacterium]|nr:leucine--tRNA ligase [Pseudobdellovibrionaceae bacterium]|tara:strand:- start:10395 stop:12803 length:2409 start_codon:yes stop_codon:yes gene_type:complete
MSYPFEKIDEKWQARWEEASAYSTPSNHKSDKKFYALSMFPYPSGSGLHVGHLASYLPNEILSRYKRCRGYDVLHPMGYDAFGLPAEQYAIQTGVHPAVTTEKSINTFRKQLQSFGFSYDWSREVSTCDPGFYKWTQFIFSKLYEKGLAYQKEVPVNWCPALKTVLANEEVIDGKSERGGHPVHRVPMKQWMLKITAYAERLLKDLDTLDWPERTKEGQRNWIGRSDGALIRFQVMDSSENFEVFTTRPDTLFGVTFAVLAPEHPLVSAITTKEQLAEVQKYQEQTSRRSEVDRKASEEKTGVFTGAYAENPFHKGQKIPIWIADYVLMDYGTGAIMAVPGHDERDFEFAQKFDLPVQRVIESTEPLPYSGDGKLIHSDFLNGLDKSAAIQKAIEKVEELKLGERQVQYKLRDWLFSRQRYWGEPFPIVNFEDGTQKALGPDELPVTLPQVADYEPTEKGEPPLARVKEFVEYTDPKTGKKGLRETDTMPGSAGSSWYFLRYTDPKNSDEAFSFEAQKQWMPVDLYVGGAEHTVGHLLYARFWQKVLFDAGLVSHEEPFQKLAHQGMILGPDHQKMSKSRGNVINPDEVREQFGADAVRLYICFMGPFEKDKPWATSGIEGVKRFLERVWRLGISDDGQVLELPTENSEDVEKALHKAIKKVTEDLENMSFNTAISALMILVNEAYKAGGLNREGLKTLTQLLSPFAPHLSEELWEKLGGEGLVTLKTWPSFDPEKVKDDVVTMAVQVLGKTRGTIEISLDTSEEEAVKKAKEITSVKNAIEGKTIAKVIYKPGKILNLIAK